VALVAAPSTHTPVQPAAAYVAVEAIDPAPMPIA
jgi:hypothetical protein